MTTHTPGPWSAYADTAGTEIIEAESGAVLATVEAACDEPSGDRANARLIAAAPELLAACQELVAEWALGGIFGDRASRPASVYFAEAAIRMALGDQP